MNQHIGARTPFALCYTGLMAKDPKQFPLPIVDKSGLTDADRREINKLKRAWEIGGEKGLQRAISELFKNPINGTRLMFIFYPELVPAVIKDEMGKLGMTKVDMEAWFGKLRSSARKQ